MADEQTSEAARVRQEQPPPQAPASSAHPFDMDPSIALGRGGSAVVHPGKHGGHKVAVKRLLLTPTEVKLARNEIDLLLQLNHPNVLRCFSNVETMDSLYIALELCDMDLGRAVEEGLLHSQPSVPLSVCSQMAEGMLYLHHEASRKLSAIQLTGDGASAPIRYIIHGDLKPGNVLLQHQRDGHWKAKIADMGAAMKVTKTLVSLKTGHVCGTVGWMAAELLGEVSRMPSRASDVFSLGCLFYFTLAAEYGADRTLLPSNHLFGANPHMRTTRIMAGTPSLDALRIGPDAADLISNMIALDPNHRPSMEAVVEHPTFQHALQLLEAVCMVSDSFDGLILRSKTVDGDIQSACAAVKELRSRLKKTKRAGDHTVALQKELEKAEASVTQLKAEKAALPEKFVLLEEIFAELGLKDVAGSNRWRRAFLFDDADPEEYEALLSSRPKPGKGAEAKRVQEAWQEQLSDLGYMVGVPPNNLPMPGSTDTPAGGYNLLRSIRNHKHHFHTIAGNGPAAMQRLLRAYHGLLPSHIASGSEESRLNYLRAMLTEQNGAGYLEKLYMPYVLQRVPMLNVAVARFREKLKKSTNGTDASSASDDHTPTPPLSAWPSRDWVGADLIVYPTPVFDVPETASLFKGRFKSDPVAVRAVTKFNRTTKLECELDNKRIEEAAARTPNRHLALWKEIIICDRTPALFLIHSLPIDFIKPLPALFGSNPSRQDLQRTCLEIADGLAYLHAHNIQHGRLSLDRSVLLYHPPSDASPMVKLTDFCVPADDGIPGGETGFHPDSDLKSLARLITHILTRGVETAFPCAADIDAVVAGAQQACQRLLLETPLDSLRCSAEDGGEYFFQIDHVASSLLPVLELSDLISRLQTLAALDKEGAAGIESQHVVQVFEKEMAFLFTADEPSWKTALDTDVLAALEAHLCRAQKGADVSYNGASAPHLLRALRNFLHHHPEFDAAMRANHGFDGAGGRRNDAAIFAYFDEKYPGLFFHLHEFRRKRAVAAARVVGEWFATHPPIAVAKKADTRLAVPGQKVVVSCEASAATDATLEFELALGVGGPVLATAAPTLSANTGRFECELEFVCPDDGGPVVFVARTTGTAPLTSKPCVVVELVTRLNLRAGRLAKHFGFGNTNTLQLGMTSTTPRLEATLAVGGQRSDGLETADGFICIAQFRGRHRIEVTPHKFEMSVPPEWLAAGFDLVLIFSKDKVDCCIELRRSGVSPLRFAAI